MGRILGSTLQATRAAQERKHTRVNYYLTLGCLIGATLFGYGLDIDLAVVAVPGIVLVSACVVLLATRND